MGELLAAQPPSSLWTTQPCYVCIALRVLNPDATGSCRKTPPALMDSMLLGGGLFVLLVSLSRVYLGVHYPSDIVADWVASFAWVMGLSSILYGRLGKPTPAAGR